MGKFYITTPIYYVNDVPHIGHAYCTIATDVMARYHRMCGDDVFFLTGVDEHGQNIERIAMEKGVPVGKYCDDITAQFVSLWKKLEISNDYFVRTTDERHKSAAQKFFRAIYDSGDIYKGHYEGWYCAPCEAFYTEKDLLDGNRCPIHERPAEWIKEENYFFALSKYQDRLLKLIEENPEFLQPESRRNEVLNIIRSGLEDRSVTRSSVKWGVPVPIAGGEGVIYVWFDALSNYITAIGYEDDLDMMEKYWPADVHLIGKEILIFHAIIWPALLMSAGIPLPKRVFGHGFLTKDGKKISKTTGNIINPNALIDEFGTDAVRYFFMREYTFGSDGDFTREAFILRINSDLANDLGNLLNRTLAMVNQNFDGIVPQPSDLSDNDKELVNLALGILPRTKPLIDELAFSSVLEVIWELVRRANKYLDESAPWRLAKDPANKDRVATILYNCVETLRFLSILLTPFIPNSSLKIQEQIGIAEKLPAQTFADLQWGKTPSNISLGKVEPIFPRIEVEVKQEAKASDTTEITIDDFKKIELKVVQILTAEAVEGADKLLRLTVETGSGVRDVVAGIAQYYPPSELVGMKVILVSNLKPAKVRGIESQGMILAAVGKSDLSVLTVQKDMPVGTKVR
jgi:methionyl-tRNA synthetase